MKKRLIIYLFLSLFSFTYILSGQNGNKVKLKFVTPLDLYGWAMVDDFNFEKIKNWNLNYKSGGQEKRYTPIFYRKVDPGADMGNLEGGRFLLEKYKKNPSCLGIKIQFPERIQTCAFVKPKEGYKLDGVCREVSLWILGRGKNVDIEIVFSDYLGRYYYLPICKLDFLGWKYFRVKVPESIPQNYNVFPQRETLKFEGFLAINHPLKFAYELYQPFYLYVDQLEVRLDRNAESYPGLEISDGW